MKFATQARSGGRNPEASASDLFGIAYRGYRTFVSPILHSLTPTNCVYLPSCSEYAYTAIHRFGLFRGSWLALCRLLRCHPWAHGGLDPVPEQRTSALASQASDQRGENHLP